MPRIIAIVGTASPSRDLANLEPPEVERWGQGDCIGFLKRIDRFFELHTKPWIYQRRGKHFVGFMFWLQHAPCPVYMQEIDPTIPKSVRYPLEELTEVFGLEDPLTGQRHGYFTSSIAYMLALAIHERPDEIRLFGIKMSSPMEYAHQRSGCEYYLGWARALGIKVSIPSDSPILKAARYGRLVDSRMTIEVLEQRKRELLAEEKKTELQLIAIRAQSAEVDYWINQVNGIISPPTIPDGQVVSAGHDGRVALPSHG